MTGLLARSQKREAGDVLGGVLGAWLCGLVEDEGLSAAVVVVVAVAVVAGALSAPGVRSISGCSGAIANLVGVAGAKSPGDAAVGFGDRSSLKLRLRGEAMDRKLKLLRIAVLGAVVRPAVVEERMILLRDEGLGGQPVISLTMGAGGSKRAPLAAVR